MSALIVIPTYNERDNIQALVPKIFAENPGVHILVVDDRSPDETYKVVTAMAEGRNDLFLLLREKKEGLGKAYLAGFKWALDRGYDRVVEMDADFSHRPEDLKKMLKALDEFDFVVGSRWIKGGATVNWGFGRKLISKGGSFYARSILKYPLKDWTGGFNAWTAKVLRKILAQEVRSEGYSFQIELKYRALRLGFRGTEVPIIFEDRRVGQSKMSSKIVIEALHRVWTIRNVGL